MSRERNEAKRAAEKFVNDPTWSTELAIRRVYKSDAMWIYELGYLRGSIEGITSALKEPKGK